LRQPGIAMDIDQPADLAAFIRQSAGQRTRTLDLLDTFGVTKMEPA
jgi:hypothetical protein